jgi:hypothetical protein
LGEAVIDAERVRYSNSVLHIRLDAQWPMPNTRSSSTAPVDEHETVAIAQQGRGVSSILVVTAVIKMTVIGTASAR